MNSWSWLAPRALWLLALLPPLWLLTLRSRASQTRTRQIAALLLRTLSVCALTLALAQPIQQQPHHESATVILVDVSDSMEDSALHAAERFVEQAQQQRGAHELALLTFAGEPHRQPLPAPGAPCVIARPADGQSSDLERALSLALGMLGDGRIPQLVLFSDGRETQGSLARALAVLREHDVPLWIQTPVHTTPELGVLELAVPAVLKAGEPFAVTARIVASQPLRAHARLTQNGADNAPEAERELILPAGESVLRFSSLVHRAGSVRYRLELTPDGPDRFADNNHFELSAEVHGAPRVLYVERESEQAYALLDLLRAAGFEAVLRSPDQAPSSRAELASFDFYILSDVPAESLSRAASSAIARYLAEGGGFLMAGGERAFGLGGYRGTALESLLPVALDSTARRDQASLALVLAIDKSGSMAGEKLERAKEAALATAELMPSDSYLGVIGFDAQPEQVVRLALTAPSTLARKVSSLSAGGGTALFPALDAAYAALAGVRARVKHVVVLTDGQTQEESLVEIARGMRADGITISTVGLGEEVNRGLLTELARLGSGRAYFTRDPSKVPRLFTEETQLVARSLAVEQRVRARRVANAAAFTGVDFERAPALRGYVSTRARAAPAQLLLVSDTDEPLLARMRVGRGWSLAFTSDLKPRWSVDWFQWQKHAQLWAQLIREHMRHEDEPSLPIETRLEGDLLHATIDVLDPRARFLNGLTGTLELADDRGGARSVPLRQTAPGRYQAELRLPALGAYVLHAQLGSVAEPQAPPILATGRVSHAFPAEYRPPFGSDQTGLLAAAERTHGGQVPPVRALFSASGRTAYRPVERWPLLVWLSLALFLGDLAVRRPWGAGSGRSASERQGT